MFLGLASDIIVSLLIFHFTNLDGSSYFLSRYPLVYAYMHHHLLVIYFTENNGATLAKSCGNHRQIHLAGIGFVDRNLAVINNLIEERVVKYPMGQFNHKLTRVCSLVHLPVYLLATG